MIRRNNPSDQPPIIQEPTYLGILASLVPFLLPNPLCRPIRLA